jgi:hypothetical protein
LELMVFRRAACCAAGRLVVLADGIFDSG